jgi:opacity protein-like surface antigen
MNKIIVLAVFCLMSSLATAKDYDVIFDGPYIQAGYGFSSSSADIAFTSGSDQESYKGGQTGGNGNVTVGYSHDLPGPWNIAANVFYNYGSKSSGQYNWPGYAYQSTLTNIKGVVLEPGFLVDDNALSFLKLGYATATQGVTVTNVIDISGGGAGSYSGTVRGFLYGLGFKQQLTENIFAGMELYQIKFSTLSLSAANTGITQKPSFTYGGLNVGYTF